MFPFFIFIVGVSIVLSQRNKGTSSSTKNILFRSIKIFSLGVFLGCFGEFMYHVVGLGESFSLSDIRIPGVLQRIALVYLSCAILYDFLFRTSIGFNMLFLEEIWSRNFTNLFIAPMKISEIIVSLVFTALIRALIGLVPAILLTSPLFGISLLDLGIPLAFLFLSLYVFGITLGLFVSAGLLRFGPSFENIAWSTMFLLAPFGCIYYPVETLPEIFQSIAYALPLSLIHI